MYIESVLEIPVQISGESFPTSVTREKKLYKHMSGKEPGFFNKNRWLYFT